MTSEAGKAGRYTCSRPHEVGLRHCWLPILLNNRREISQTPTTLQWMKGDSSDDELCLLYFVAAPSGEFMLSQVAKVGAQKSAAGNKLPTTWQYIHEAGPL